MAGCATQTAELRHELEGLLQQTLAQVRQESQRVDGEVAQLRAAVGQLRSEVGQVDSRVGRLRSDVRQLGSDVSLLQTNARKSDTSLVDLAVRVNQLDRRVGRREAAAAEDGERPAAAGSPQPTPPGAAGAAAPMAAGPGLRPGMSQQDVVRLLGQPHEVERVLDAVYWYYGDGALQGGYVRFDAASGQVNGWSPVAPQPFQLELRTTQGGPVR
jgi:TolA-binding protein